uniref:Uncharacterized protein n=1 Tax=Helianthus annuus TaxID=4232 RepID=A0A251VMH2_HELAN
MVYHVVVFHFVFIDLKPTQTNLTHHIWFYPTLPTHSPFHENFFRLRCFCSCASSDEFCVGLIAVLILRILLSICSALLISSGKL